MEIGNSVTTPYLNFMKSTVTGDVCNLLNAYDKDKQEGYWIRISKKIAMTEAVIDVFEKYRDDTHFQQNISHHPLLKSVWASSSLIVSAYAQLTLTSKTLSPWLLSHIFWGRRRTLPRLPPTGLSSEHFGAVASGRKKEAEKDLHIFTPVFEFHPLQFSF